MKTTWLVIVSLFLVLVQVGLINNLMSRWRPDVVLILLTVGIFTLSYRRLLIISLLSAFVLDLFSSLPFGVVTVSLGATVLLSRLIKDNFFATQSWLPVVVVASFLPFIFHGLSYLFSEFYNYITSASLALDYFGERLIHSTLPLMASQALLVGLLILLRPKFFDLKGFKHY